MADLKANLARLDEEVPAFPGKVAAVARSAAALEQTANAMLQQFAQKGDEVEKLTEQVRQALTELQGEGTDQEGLVRNRADDAEAAAATALGAIRSGRDELISAVDDAGVAFEGLRDFLATAEGRVRAAQGEAAQALGELEGGLEAGSAALGTSLGQVTDAVVGVTQAIESGLTAVGEATSALGDRMSELLAAAQSRLDTTQSELSAAAATTDAGIGEAVGDLAERKDTLFQELTARVESELRARLDVELQAVVESLGVLAQTVTVSKDGIAAERESVAAQFRELAKRFPALTAGIDSVKEAAETVGFSY
jgi:uncharacterized phage infection (PIP) family protein YhgE